ncbi:MULTISPECIES: aspartate/glutamate racemase family protein [unclassified Bradyrhizobium]|uniref:aspartate/glutamate racemase family protein n=1 Tax=unclassified Bradyrhizobium TaxID=2631580 RepID=UPI00247A586B|nr:MULTISPECIES: aspartate/glutamate racemase family protein [unclassified Bradyrhizobium]WGR70771.1 aspartate/glutamate racemase family protein [Bradyrhizobium sp. ISRA426]WGR75611.1 aspartate/glutamate racemase family protein [Bradyrhizobium sp. ISRA430]WGR86014.1 aspartate/glutamate racemase family protein [Bradyrhizobium sp. ISRA432]
MTPRRILVINPNSSASVTAAIDDAVAPLRIAGGPEITVEGLAEGPPSITSQRDADSVVMPLVNRVARDDADAFVLACFSDPGLHAVREAADGRPVMGIAEWGILRALTLGERFGVIALSSSSIRRQQRMVRQIGVETRYAGSWSVGASAAETAGADIRGRLIEAGRALVSERGADVVVMGCAGMASHRAAIAEAIGVPVVEPAQQAVAAAIGAVLLTA